MKMKKLTALALAGVLCLGMSTTAFAAQSPNRNKMKDTVSSAVMNDSTKPGSPVDLLDQYDENGNWTGGLVSTDVEYGVMDGWVEKDNAKASQNIKDTLNKYLASSTNEEEIADLSKLDLSDDAYYEVVTAQDYTLLGADGEKVGLSPNESITLTFDLGDRDVVEGQKVYLMHFVTRYDGSTVWEVFEHTVEWIRDDNGNPVLGVKQEFTDLSPVAILKTNSDGSFTPVDPVEPEDPTEPTDPTKPTDPSNGTSVPNANGQITADQLADLIASRLTQNANAVRVTPTAASTKNSPKTGE